MTLVNLQSIKGDSDNFKKGITLYPNARDWAREQREELIEQQNGISHKSAGTTRGRKRSRDEMDA
jgi:hypothetical protein